MVNEASVLSTGYSTYGMEVLSRLHASGKYEVAELACYVTAEDVRIKRVPWKVFPNYPSNYDKEGVELYHSKQTHEFGSFSFEKTCIEFKPDIVFDIRDWWMMEFAETSPFRRLYKWAIMPTVDAEPQHEQWISTYMIAVAVLSYSDWGVNTLRKEGGSLINVMGSASPGADTKTFHPMDKAEVRGKFGFDSDDIIIGTVMRNQGRKLYPELITAFAEFLSRAPADIAKRAYLYLHTSYPDQGWDIPQLIKKSGVSNKIVLTYKCSACQAVFPSFYMDVVGPCLKCGSVSASIPNNQHGVDRVMLARIMNMFDCYVQYANSEGFGMPMVEAASCGLTVFATDYSAMSDVVRKVHGYPVAVDRYQIDPHFGCNRAFPSNRDFVDKLIKFFSHTQAERDRKGKQARQGVEKHYTWEQTAKKWMTVFDQLVGEKGYSLTHKWESTCPTEIMSKKSLITDSTCGKMVNKSHSSSGNKKSSANGLKPDVKDECPTCWNSPPKLHMPNISLPRDIEKTNEELVRWSILNVLGRPDLLNSYLSLRLIRDLNWGLSMKKLTGNYANEDSFLATHGNLRPFKPEDMIQELKLMCDNNNYWEQKRWETVQDLLKLETT